jgi:hypothetical protein
MMVLFKTKEELLATGWMPVGSGCYHKDGEVEMNNRMMETLAGRWVEITDTPSYHIAGSLYFVSRGAWWNEVEIARRLMKSYETIE